MCRRMDRTKCDATLKLAFERLLKPDDAELLVSSVASHKEYVHVVARDTGETNETDPKRLERALILLQIP